MMNSGYRLALMGYGCGGGQISNAFDSNREFLDLLLVQRINLLWFCSG